MKLKACKRSGRLSDIFCKSSVAFDWQKLARSTTLQDCWRQGLKLRTSTHAVSSKRSPGLVALTFNGVNTHFIFRRGSQRIGSIFSFHRVINETTGLNYAQKMRTSSTHEPNPRVFDLRNECRAHSSFLHLHYSNTWSLIYTGNNAWSSIINRRLKHA